MRLPSRRTVRLVLGFLLVLTPLWGPALDLTAPDYTYESTDIAVENDRLVIPDEDARAKLWHGVHGFDCYYDTAPVPRFCALEATTLNGSVEADHPAIEYSTGGTLATPSRFLAYDDGRVFRYDSQAKGGHYVLRLNRVSAESALRVVARPEGSYPPAAVEAIRTGSVTTNDELWPNENGARVVELDDRTYLVYQTGVSQTLGSNPAVEESLTWLAVVFGTVLLVERDAEPG